MLERLRRDIDGIDKKILKLLSRRLNISKKIGEYKKMNHFPVQDKAREKKLIEDRLQRFQELGFDDPIFVQELFQLIMKKSREVQSKKA